MIFIFARFFLRITILIVSVFSIFYFYILGYRFESNLGFLKTSGVYSFEKLNLDNEKQIILNGKTYNMSNEKITLYNNFIQKSCGEMKVGTYQSYFCYNDNGNHIVYISKNNISLTLVQKSIYRKFILQKETSPNINYSFFWKNIKFFYYKNGDIVYKDDISSKKLMTIPNIEFVGYNSKGFFVIKNNNLYFMRLVK